MVIEYREAFRLVHVSAFSGVGEWGEMGWTGSSDEENNNCQWKLDGNGHAVKKGDCVGDLKMDVSKRGCWLERWLERD